jgi:glycosyltransferase involved in cell wall biosynthesis
MNEPTVSILLPVCNEVDVIEEVISEWIQVLNRLPSGSKILIEDANSTDGTQEVLKKFKIIDKRIDVMFQSERDGFANALKRLFSLAETDYIFVADTDGQYYISDFQFFEAKLKRQFTFIKGVKVNRQDSFFRKLFSFLMNRFIITFFGFPFLDYNSSHYLIKTKLVKDFSEKGWNFRYSINVEVCLRAMLSNEDFSLVYVRHKKRDSGVSRGNPPFKFLWYGYQTLRDIWKLKRSF